MGWKELPKQKVKDLLSKDLNDETLNELFKDKTLFINSENPATITSLNNELLNAFNTIKSKGVQPLFMGSKTCDLEAGKARLSIELATKASNMKVPKVWINQKAEQLFLYGRDVWSSSIIKTEGTLTKGKIAFIYNEQNLFIGLAFPLNDNIKTKENTTTLRNILDIGLYLRIEKR